MPAAPAPITMTSKSTIGAKFRAGVAIRAQPMDAVVLIGGCDKTVPAQLMGAASANLPAIQLVTGSTGGAVWARRESRSPAC